MYLNKFSTSVDKKGEDYIVNYEDDTHYGHCIYRSIQLTGSNKPIRQSVLLMTHCQMGEIIDSINETTPLTEEDHDGLSKEIREHSREVLTSYLSGNEEVLG
jgi:hypothetical protein